MENSKYFLHLPMIGCLVITDKVLNPVVEPLKRADPLIEDPFRAVSIGSLL